MSLPVAAHGAGLAVNGPTELRSLEELNGNPYAKRLDFEAPNGTVESMNAFTTAPAHGTP